MRVLFLSQVVQIVGGTLGQSTGTVTNHVASNPPAYFADTYKRVLFIMFSLPLTLAVSEDTVIVAGWRHRRPCDHAGP